MSARVEMIIGMPAPPRHTLINAQGETLDGHDLDLLRVGADAPGKRKVWIVARQHPGESMAGARRCRCPCLLPGCGGLGRAAGGAAHGMVGRGWRR